MLGLIFIWICGVFGEFWWVIPTNGEKSGQNIIKKIRKWLNKTANIYDEINYKLTYWHYEGRYNNNLSEFNNSCDAYDYLVEVRDGGTKNGWRREKRDACHQDGDQYKEEKYCNEDGREIVFNGKSINDGNPSIDNNSDTMGTYNYCDPGLKPTNDNGKNNVVGWTEYIGKGIGHGVCDLIPYYFLGNTRADDKSIKGVYQRLKGSVMK